ncbi:MAG: single-stranded DNA-binding protein [Candidatus Moranbacteria bacterium]|nr:single-stranded DNA-binding protein [Candidatus Moranbacteria bacterium]
MDLNKAMIIGRLTNDPQMRSTQTGQNVTSFSLATNRRWNNRNTGQQQEDVQFHNIVAWGKVAEICSQYLKKGSRIYVEGRLQTQSWDDAKTGEKKYRTEINLENMIMLDSKGQNPGGGNNFQQPATQNNTTPQNNDIPAAEEIPTINVDDDKNGSDDIKIEDIPF